MSVGTFASYFGLHLGRTASMGPRDVLLLFGLGLHLGLFLLGTAFAATLEGDSAHDDGINIISSEHIVFLYVEGSKGNSPHKVGSINDGTNARR